MASDSEIALPDETDTAAAAPVENPGLSLDMPLIPPLDMQGRGRWIACVMAAAVLHAAVFGILNWPVADSAIGGGGTDLEAISVDVVQASALETAVDGQTAGAAASMAHLADRDGAERQQMAAADSPDRKPEKQPETAAKAETAVIVMPDAAIKPEPPLPDVPAIVIAPTKAEEPVEGPEKPAEKVPPTEPKVAAAASAPSDAVEAQEIGGATARGLSPVEMAVKSAAIALTGELGAYARLVQQAVARNPPRLPRGSSGRGDVIITFALGLDGTLIRAQIDASSGNSDLDEAALAVVRKARFPTPPAGSQPTQLVYKFPVKFR